MSSATNKNGIHSLNLLVVEDNAFASLEVCKALKNIGIGNIETATNGREALDKIDELQTPPDVILVDLRMPVMGGVELLNILSGRKFSGHVILVTAVDEETLALVERDVRESNVNLLGCLSKPVDVQQLSSLLNKVTDE